MVDTQSDPLLITYHLVSEISANPSIILAREHHQQVITTTRHRIPGRTAHRITSHPRRPHSNPSNQIKSTNPKGYHRKYLTYQLIFFDRGQINQTLNILPLPPTRDPLPAFTRNITASITRSVFATLRQTAVAIANLRPATLDLSRLRRMPSTGIAILKASLAVTPSILSISHLLDIDIPSILTTL